MFSLFRPSGGLHYHWRAWREGAHWISFRAQVATWLNSWAAGDEVVLIGPSGGYTLPTSWLASRARVTIYDLDPLAGWIFRRQHPNVRFQFTNRDLFWRERRLSVVPVQQVLAERPAAAVLFCNVLGQLPLEGHVSDADFAAFLIDLRATLKGRAWASYHDLYSLEPAPQALHGKWARSFEQAGELPREASRSLTITDHLLAGPWSAGLTRTRMTWSLTESRLHMVEGVSAELK